MDAELRKQPAADEGTDDSNDEVTDDAEPGASHYLAGKPSGNETNHQYDQETLTRHIHVRILQISSMTGQSPPNLRKGSPFGKDGVTNNRQNQIRK
jgi:hypothetical protein